VLKQRLFELKRRQRALWLARTPARHATRQPAYRHPPPRRPGSSAGRLCARGTIIVSALHPSQSPSGRAQTHVWPPACALAGPPAAPPVGEVLHTSTVACLPSSSLPSRRCSHVPSALPAPIKGSSTIPVHAHRPTGPPLPPLRWTRTSARFHRRPSPRAPFLCSSRAPKAACSPALHLPSPESEPRRERCRGLATVTRRHHLRTRHHPESIRGEPNRPPVPFVHLLRPPFAAGELTLPPEGTVVNSQGHMCKPGTNMWWSLT
jgi:hypothetical protein